VVVVAVVAGGCGGGTAGDLFFLFFSKKYLPSARRLILVKQLFAVKTYAECHLPSVTLGKRFAECFWGFAECPWHSTKFLYPVVTRTIAVTMLQMCRFSTSY